MTIGDGVSLHSVAHPAGPRARRAINKDALMTVWLSDDRQQDFRDVWELPYVVLPARHGLFIHNKEAV